MATKVKSELRGIVLEGEVTDMDAFFVASYMMPSYGDVLEKESGLFEAFQSFSAEHAAMVAIAGEAGKEAVIERMSQSWAERVILRLNTNLSMRSAFAQRMREIFPTMPTNLINHKRWNDKEGNVHEESSIRLDMKEVMDLLAPVLAVLNEATVPAPKASETQDDITDLKVQLAALKKDLEKSKPEGFGKPVHAAAEV